jgi:hypothetical protein
LDFRYLDLSFSHRLQRAQHSGIRDNKPNASIMEIRPNSVDRGADISEFSQYSGEKEFLIMPYSFVQGDGRQRTEVTE